MVREPLALLQGTLDMLILKALEGEAAHGYAVASWIREVSGEVLQVEDGALYTALHRMEKRGWLESEWGRSESNRRARFYRLTAKGRQRMAHDRASWGAYVDAVSRVLAADRGAS
jgi:transcriptional regulator